MKATINLSSGFFSKNGTPFADLNYTDETEYNQLATYFLNIGELEKTVNIDEFQKAYWRSDTEQKHPIYYMPYDETAKFDLKGQEITPFIIDNTSTLHKKLTTISEGDSFSIGRGVKTNGEYDNTSARNMYSNTDNPENTINNLYPDYYGVRRCYGYYNNEYRPYMIDSLDTCMSMIKPLQSTMETYFTGYNGSGIKCYLDDVKDKVIAPAFRSALSTGVVGDDGRLIAYDMTYTDELINFYPVTAVDSGTYDFPDDHYGAGAYMKSNIFNKMSFRKADNEQWTTIYQLPGFGIKNDILYYTQIDNNYSYRTPVIILKDSSDDYWFLYLSGIKSYGSSISEGQSTMGSNAPVVVLLPIKELPELSTASNRAVNRSDVSSYIIDELDGDEEYYKLLMKRVFNPQSGPSYDDGGPDAVGPGDPYEDENNAGEAVGGDANIVDDITPPDISPNTSYENFIIGNGLYGSYKLTTANLLNYTKTLQLCRDNAWMPGELGDKFENMGNLIQENTVSVFMLPVDIADEETISVPFNVGTKAIRKNDNVGNWGQPASVDMTSLINKYTKEYVYPLGTISHYYDNFLDFSPYSTASLYIPYIGKVEIPINLVQSTSTDQKQLSLSIRLNRTNGDILCILLSNNIPLCRWQGNCARSIALSVNDNSAILQNQFSRLVSSFSSGLGALGAAATGNVGGATSNLGQMFAAPMASGAPITTSSHMIGNAPETGDVGWMDSQLITLTVERPIWWKPFDYGDLIGYPTRKIAKLSTVSGFAKVPNIHIRCSATESEKERLKAMLAEGVLF